MWTILTLSLACSPQSGTSFQSAAAAPWTRGSAPAPLFSQRAAPAFPFDPTLFGRGVAAADLDLDGDADFLIATGGGVRIYRNTGASGFVDDTAATFPFGLAGASLPIVGDLTGDGRPDILLLAAQEPDLDVLLVGSVGGGYLAPTPLPQAATITSDAEIADIDGDGDLDIVRAIGASGHAISAGLDGLLLNDGFGVFTESSGFATATWNDPNVPTTGVTALDANGDGVLDLFMTRADNGSATGSPGAQNLLLFGVGGGTFIDGTGALPILSDQSFDAVALDLEGDGDLDLVVANSVLSVNGANSGDVLVNQGGAQSGRAGVFVDRAGSIDETPPLAESIRLGPLAADVDGDGRTDVLMRVHDLPPGGGQPLFLGAGLDFRRAGQFGTSSFIAAGGAFADIDGDGDPDLLLTSSGSAAGSAPGNARLFLNVSR